MSIDIIYYTLKVSAVGGVVAADETSCGQFMVSRPIAAGLLTGVVTGNILLGTAVGALFELLYMDILPFGGSKFHSAGSAAVIMLAICGYLGLSKISEVGGIIPLLILYSALTAAVGGRLVVAVRRINGWLLRAATGSIRSGNFRRAGLIHLSGILVSFLRGFFTILTAFAMAVPFREFFLQSTRETGPGSTYLLMPFLALGLCIALRMYLTKKRIIHLLLGGFITVVLLSI